MAVPKRRHRDAVDNTTTVSIISADTTAVNATTAVSSLLPSLLRSWRWLSLTLNESGNHSIVPEEWTEL
jgi:hypothetical protein